MSENLIIFNAKVVTPLGFSARKGKEMAELRILEKATVEVVDGIITYVGPNRGEVRDGYYHHFWHYNARGKCLLPGFVDSHTHFVFGGERAEEFSWRLKGESYMSIMQRGGGIASTVQATRELSFIHLRSKAEGLLKKMTAMGITTVEGKSGYGLNRETELLHQTFRPTRWSLWEVPNWLPNWELYLPTICFMLPMPVSKPWRVREWLPHSSRSQRLP